MRILLFLALLTLPFCVFSQVKPAKELDINSRYERAKDTVKKQKIASHDMYRFVSLERDTTYVDTSLTIKTHYKQNYLRKDTFGLLPFPNDGQTYNTLDFGWTNLSPLPTIGFKAKHFNFLEANQIYYASVATPFTELYFNTTQARGQSVDSYLTLNVKENLNFSIAYRGLRSEGKYINQMSSTGNFRFTVSFNSKNKRYYSNAHYTFQDILNEENGGITTISDFESENPDYDNRQRMEVYLKDAKSFLKGKRVFIDHNFRINPKFASNNLYVSHQMNYENKFFEYNQQTVASEVGSEVYNRFGPSYIFGGINDQTHYNKMYNKIGLTYENILLGKFQFFADDFQSNYYYNQILIYDNGIVPNKLNRQINSVGGQYDYRKDKWKGSFLYSRSLTNQSLSNLDARAKYHWSDQIQLAFQYQNINKLPDDNYNLYQSSYLYYNWAHDFKNEKINSLSANAITPWVTASVQLTSLKDHLFYEDISANEKVQLVNPNQYEKNINYVSVKLAKEFKYGKFALDNTLLYQKVAQDDAVLNVPDFVTRNTVYFTDYFFKKALYLQTGISFNYFTKYLADDYNPVVGAFFVQNRKEIGGYPNFDFFVNARIQRTRIYFKAEHFNSSLTGNNFYAAPNMPFRDFTIRFGLVWNFFN